MSSQHLRVTICRDARSVRPLYQRLQHRGFNEDGRSDRASLQRVTRLVESSQTPKLRNSYVFKHRHPPHRRASRAGSGGMLLLWPAPAL